MYYIAIKLFNCIYFILYYTHRFVGKDGTVANATVFTGLAFKDLYSTKRSSRISVTLTPDRESWFWKIKVYSIYKRSNNFMEIILKIILLSLMFHFLYLYKIYLYFYVHK